MFDLPHYRRETRWLSPENPTGEPGQGGASAAGRKGMPYFFLRPGRELVLADIQGTSGVIRRIWMTLHNRTPCMLRQLRLKFFWDDAKTAAVDVPLGDFFGMGLGRMAPFAGTLMSSPEGRSFLCQIPMPFRKAARIVLCNEGVITAGMIFYEINLTLGDEMTPAAGYFHAWYHQEHPTMLRDDYTLLAPVSGRGRFLGASFGVAMDQEKYGKSWGGEGEIKFYLDGDQTRPTLCGTGTEDYIGTGWSQGVFSHPESGCTVADVKAMHLCFYRYHIRDPIYFHRSLRVTIQQIGSWDPKLLDFFAQKGTPLLRAGLKAQSPPQRVDPADPSLPPFDLFERSDSWSSCCYFYLDCPENDLPPLPCFHERVKTLPDFSRKELLDMKEDFEPLEIARRRIPDFNDLEITELRKLRDALDQIVEFQTAQDDALSRED